IDTDSRTEVWRDTHKKFEDALGLPGIRDVFGAKDANKINVPAAYGPKEKDTNKAVSNALFSAPDVQKKKIDLLQVVEQAKKVEGATEESVNPYIWRTPVEPLNEITNVSQKQRSKEDFYRVEGVDAIFTRRMGPQFENCYYAVLPKPTPTAGTFLYSLNGARPRSGLNAVRNVQQYAFHQYKEPLLAAIAEVKGLIKNPDDMVMLDQLASLDLYDLPTAIFNSIMVGILDAANVGVHKENESLTPARNKIGHQVLEPHIAIRSLQDALFVTARQGDSLELPTALSNKITTALANVKASGSAYDLYFKNALIEAAKKNKWNIKKTSQSAKTTMSFILAQVINQINNNRYNIDLSSTPEVSSRVYLSRFGFDDTRISEFAKVFESSRVRKNCPIVVIRGKLGGASDNLVYSIDTTISDSDNDFAFTLSNIKPLGLTSMVHEYMKHEAVSRFHVLNKENYLKTVHDLFDNTENIQSARNGPAYLQRMLETALNDDLSFQEGVFFVGLSPMFWDAPNGNDVKVTTSNLSFALSNIVWPYRLEGGDYSTLWGYTIEKAEELFFDRIADAAIENIHPTDPQAKEKLAEMTMAHVVDDAPLHIIKERQSQLLHNKRCEFTTLPELRDKILKTLYNLGTSENENINNVEKLLKSLYTNVSAGFWTTTGDELGGNLACYNPWRKGRVLYARFTSENVSENIAKAARANAAETYRSVSGRETDASGSFTPLKKP
ncbi:MAG: hypothetical protein JHC33_04290, partial [Ignisphaera sp.]|nr:hypothetical protein [Ignisphaera sp.]